jgi:hypothetical protein
MPPKKVPVQKMSLGEFHATVAESKSSKSQTRKSKRKYAAFRKALHVYQDDAANQPSNAVLPVLDTRSRKPRNRGAPNDWPILRLCRNIVDRCAVCVTCISVGAIRHKQLNIDGVQIGTVLMFNPFAYKSVIAGLIVLRRYAGVTLGYDVIFMIMKLAFEPEVAQKQLLRSMQVKTKCGCRYHHNCYAKHIAKYTKCKKCGANL